MTIVVGYVPTPEGLAAIDHALEEAARRPTRLVVINTSTGNSLVDPRYASDVDLDALRQRLTDAGVDFEIRQSVTGKDASQAILEAARQGNADLIVIGVRRRTAVGKLLLGSQAQVVLLEADCPVLAVKAPR